MTPRKIRKKVVLEKVSWIRKMVDAIHELPFTTEEEFKSDKRNVAAAESYLRRALEALLDLGRHILAKGFGVGITEYKEIGRTLAEKGVIDGETANLLIKMAGYRNRMVHFYDEISDKELFLICTNELDDMEIVLSEILAWLRHHEERLDHTL